MSEKTLQIFTLCEQLAQLLDDKEAIADIKLLYNRHPEMFKNMQEVKVLIEKVVNEPEIIIKNPAPMSNKDYIVGKKINNERMGEVGIRKDENISKIFHANEKNIKHFKRLHKKEVVYKQSVVGSLNSYTQAQSLDERLVENNISPTAKSIIPQNPNKTKIDSKESQIQAMKERVKEFTLKNNKALPTNKDKSLDIDR